ncbi:MAG: rod shape-determining protein MreC [Gammaproteobacteria bacterium]|nr:rod shape-determining protein MreC [Gammaproteobacteria bacterium]
MEKQFRKSSGWFQFCTMLVTSVVLLLVDSNTSWLNSPRNALSVALRPIQVLASVPSSIGNWVSGTMSAEPDVKIAYENLRSEYFKLKSETLLLRTLQEENAGLRALLDATERLEEKVTLAELMQVSLDRDSHRVSIRQGLSDSVYLGQAVVDDKGVIGQITEVMPLSSVVVLITDPGHAMPVQVERNGLRTIVRGTGSLSTVDVLYLNQNSDIKQGDILLSSGLGERFPNGYPVAQVVDVAIIEDEAFMRVTASPIAKLDRSNHVLLLSREAKNMEVGANQVSQSQKETDGDLSDE